MCRELSLREYEYLSAIRKADATLHRDVVEMLLKGLYKRGVKTGCHHNVHHNAYDDEVNLKGHTSLI